MTDEDPSPADSAAELSPAAALMSPDVQLALGDACLAQGDAVAAVAAFHNALVFRPRDPAVRRRLGFALLARPDVAAAERVFRDNLRLAPGDAAALVDLARLLCDLRRFAEAADLSRRALAAAPAWSMPHFLLGVAAENEGRLEEATAAYRRAVELEPALAPAQTNLAFVLLLQNRHAEVLAVGHNALPVIPQAIDLRWNLSLAELALGDFAAGWENYEVRRHSRLFHGMRAMTLPGWDGVAPLQGRTVLLHAEQGLGDTIQFVRYARLVAEAGARVLLCVHRELRSLAAAVPWVHGVSTLDEELPASDVQCPLLSLPRAFGTRLETIPADVPYLRAPAEKADRWRARLGGGCKIGLVWSGNPENLHDRRRSIPLAEFAAVTRGPSARFFSLQKNPRAADAALLPTLPHIEDLAAEFEDFTDTAAAISNLDLVITVDTAVAHLAGALGRPTWVLLPFFADWRWLMERSDSPWYPSLRLFRQATPGDWQPVLENVRRALAGRA